MFFTSSLPWGYILLCWSLRCETSGYEQTQERNLKKVDEYIKDTYIRVALYMTYYKESGTFRWVVGRWDETRLRLNIFVEWYEGTGTEGQLKRSRLVIVLQPPITLTQSLYTGIEIGSTQWYPTDGESWMWVSSMSQRRGVSKTEVQNEYREGTLRSVDTYHCRGGDKMEVPLRDRERHRDIYQLWNYYQGRNPRGF